MGYEDRLRAEEQDATTVEALEVLKEKAARCVHRDWTVWGDLSEPIGTSLSFEEMKDMVKEDKETLFGECDTCGNTYNS
jgi:hypothetical protein